MMAAIYSHIWVYHLPLNCTSDYVLSRTSSSDMVWQDIKLLPRSDGGQVSLRIDHRPGYDIMSKDPYLSRNRAIIYRGVTLVFRDMSWCFYIECRAHVFFRQDPESNRSSVMRWRAGTWAGQTGRQVCLNPRSELCRISSGHCETRMLK